MKQKLLCSSIVLLFLITGLTTAVTTNQQYPSSSVLNTPPNIPSVPQGPTYRKIGETGSYSTVAIDPDGDQIKYLFNWGDLIFDETEWVASGTMVTMNHFWTSPGNYRVTAQAKDTSGAVSTWSSPLGVQVNKAPNLAGNPLGPQEGCTGKQYSFCINATDPDDDLIQYFFDWDDGTNSGWSDLLPSGTGYCTNKTWYHAMNHPLNYSVQAKARDIHGTETEWSSNLIVAIYPTRSPNTPLMPDGPNTGFVGETYSYCTYALHPLNYNLYYQFNWGDGTTSSWQGPYPSGSTDCRVHNWSTEGAFQVQVRAKDGKCGSQSNWSPALEVLIVPNSPPGVPDKPTGNIIGKTGESYVFSTSGTDPDGHQLFYNFSWGDDTSSLWLGPYDSGDVIEASTNWSTRGQYDIKVKSRDTLGEESDWSEPLTVTMLRRNINTPVFFRFFKLLASQFPRIFDLF